MASTTTPQPSGATSNRHYQYRDERTSYTAMWVIIACVAMAALVYGYMTNSTREAPEGTPIVQTQTTTPATDGSASSMVGTSAGTALTPSVTTPGAPDTTTTESTSIPADGIR